MKNFSLNVKGQSYEVKADNSKYGEELRLYVAKPGQMKPYTVTYNPNAYHDSSLPNWSCSCTGWIMKKGAVRKCKHLEAIADMARQMEKDYAQAA
jgi:hypothetical protein